tara:strand:+ start:797 stop:961 length:165 start_codon:yes stop_codon:yes gene_type:complete
MTAKQITANLIRLNNGDVAAASNEFRAYVARQASASRSQLMIWNKVFGLLAQAA